MTKLVHLEFDNCDRCPWYREGTHKGLPNQVFSCHQVYDDKPNFQGSYRVVRHGRRDRPTPIPEWCPLPDSVPESEVVQEFKSTLADIGQIAKSMVLNPPKL